MTGPATQRAGGHDLRHLTQAHGLAVSTTEYDGDRLAMQFFRGFVKRLAVAALLGYAAVMTSIPASAQTIVVQGTQRVEAETIRSYFRGSDQGRINAAVKELYGTGLFSDVQVSRQGNTIVVRVVENQTVNRVAFEGNSRLKGAALIKEVQSRSRGAYNPSTVEADLQRLRDIYRRAGRGDAQVSVRTVPLPNGSVDVVFTINEGGKTGIRSIDFVGNNAFSSYRLRNLMNTTQMNFMSWFKDSDVYDPDKISGDLERIRRFYLKKGYADFRVTGSDARYDEASKGWVVVITVDEGQPYVVSSVRVDSRIADVDSALLTGRTGIKPGSTYDGDKVEKAVQSLTREVARKGYAFAAARPQGDRNPADRTIALSFVIEEGPRVYVEKIVVRGNTRTRDYVVRREFDIGEGDAYNRVLVDRAERRLNNLGFFKTVRISNQPGSAPDRVIIIVDVEDKPTGSFGISGGYSTQDGFIAEVSVAESNFMGRGQFARASVTLGQRTRGVELSFTEPYFMGYRLAAGGDLFYKETRNSRYALYDSTVAGATLRVGLPITEEISLGLRYSLYGTEIRLPNNARRPFNDCSIPIENVTPGNGTSPFPDPSLAGSTVTCLTNGEASLAIKEAAAKNWLTSLVGYSLTYNTLDNVRDPREGLYAEIRQDIAGLGGDAKWLRTTADMRYYYPLWDDIVAFGRFQGGHILKFGTLRTIDHFNNGSNIVRGFAPGGMGPRDISAGLDPRGAGLGGTKYAGVTAEVQFPIFGLPKEVGLRGALYVDAGTMFGYQGRTLFNEFGTVPVGTPLNAAGCVINTNNAGGVPYIQNNCLSVRDQKLIRVSAGASILWASPLGPIRFNYSFVLRKDKHDVEQRFQFTGGGSF
jgi:outer membrane protein insertion porin family